MDMIVMFPVGDPISTAVCSIADGSEVMGVWGMFFLIAIAVAPLMPLCLSFLYRW